MSKKRKYLSGTLAAAAVLAAGVDASVLQQESDQVAGSQFEVTSSADNNFVLAAPEAGTIFTQHRSHASHTSHGSHTSHSSHLSGFLV